MWHAVAARLAQAFTVVCPDLRGYGGSHKPAATPDHGPYAKRAMALELVQLMESLGYPRFQVGSHDRGARVAHRMALDHPERVERVAILDIVPTLEHFERTDMSFALGYYHWFWFAQPHPFPEALIDAAPEVWWRAHVFRGADPGFFRAEALEDYLAAARDPNAICGMCEDYRAAATIDLVHDRASRSEGRKIACPVLILWGERGMIGRWYDPPALWRAYSEGEVTGGPLPAGHYIAEEDPEGVTNAFRGFFRA
ncbi:MAG: alpha/beta hydrolase [Methylobacteriaceae bacterium]|nr:alpha/beta hydrolase [Methylobacteriaceae bacterium]